jgi:hypothetical protein
MNIQFSSKFRQHLPCTVRCQNLQLNIRHEGRQPDICIFIELSKALPIHIHILPLVILPLVIASKSLPLVTFTCQLTLLRRTTIGWAGRGWTTTTGLSRALALCFSSPLFDPPSPPPLPFYSHSFSSTPYSIAPSPFYCHRRRRQPSLLRRRGR